MDAGTIFESYLYYSCKCVHVKIWPENHLDWPALAASVHRDFMVVCSFKGKLQMECA